MSLTEAFLDKQSSNAEKQRFTREVFNAIKDDCLKIVIEKSIKEDWEWHSLYSHEILKIVCEKFSYNTRTSYYETLGLGVGKKLITKYRPSKPILHIKEDGSREKRFDTPPEEYEAKRLVRDLDYEKLEIMLRDYIISKGFKGRSGTHRFTGETIYFMEFSCSNNKLRVIIDRFEYEVEGKVKPNTNTNEVEPEDNTYHVLGVIVIVLIILSVLFFIF